MKLEITDNLIKELEKRFKRHVAPCDIAEIQGIKIDFIEGIWYTLELCWGHADCWRNYDLLFDEKNVSLDFIEGMFSQLVVDKEVEKSDY